MRALLKAGADPNAKPDARAQLHGPFHDGAYERGAGAGQTGRPCSGGGKGKLRQRSRMPMLTRSRSPSPRRLNAAMASMPLADYAVEHSEDYAAHITPLMIAANTSSLEAVKLLVQAGADLGAKDKKGRTALTYAKEGKFKRVVAYLEAAYEKRDAAGER